MNKKIFGIIICILLIITTIPSISGDFGEINIKSIEENSCIFPLNESYTNAYWEFDDCNGTTLTDSSHNYDGLIYGANWTNNSHSGCALLFDGIDDYVSLDSHSEELGLNKTDDSIYSFWFNSTNGGIIYSATAPWGYNPELRIELFSNGSLMFKAWTQACGIYLYSNNSYNDGVWHHAEFYFNGITANPTLTLYVDDVWDSSFTHWLCEIVHDDFDKTSIGAHAYSLTDNFDGYIDDFKIIKYEQGNEQAPPTIDGPISGKPGLYYEYTFVTNDPEEDEIWLYIDWGDDEPDEWIGPYNSSEEIGVSHKWNDPGDYNITAKSKDIWDDSSWSDPFLVIIGNNAPDEPSIDGPISGEIGENLTFSFVSEDFEGDELFYTIRWGDGTIKDWFGPYESGEIVTANHSWDQAGDFEITAKAKDDLTVGLWSEPFIVRIGNEPPIQPSINGPDNGTIWYSYEYSFTSEDPEDDSIYYYIDWGDGTVIDWIGPYDSGEVIYEKHKWDSEGIYNITAKVKDKFGDESNITDKYEMTISVNTSNVFLIGLITDLEEYEEYYSFKAERLFWLRITPYNFKYLTIGQDIAILKGHKGTIYNFEILNMVIAVGNFDAAII